MTKATKVDKKIGAEIELYRKLRKKTRKWLGDKLGLTYHQIRNYETGNHKIAASVLVEISKILKFSLDKFFDFKTFEKFEEK